jgi:hypothetical protein
VAALAAGAASADAAIKLNAAPTAPMSQMLRIMLTLPCMLGMNARQLLMVVHSPDFDLENSRYRRWFPARKPAQSRFSRNVSDGWRR